MLGHARNLLQALCCLLPALVAVALQDGLLALTTVNALLNSLQDTLQDEVRITLHSTRRQAGSNQGLVSVTMMSSDLLHNDVLQGLDGSAAGAVASALGSITNCACNSGLATADQQLLLTYQTLMAAADSSSMRRHAAGAEAGAAAGLAALLGAAAVVPGVPDTRSFLLASAEHAALAKNCLRASLPSCAAACLCGTYMWWLTDLNR